MASVEENSDTQDELEDKKHKEVQMSSSEVCVNMNAQTGGTVNAPVLNKNNITGPVTINITSAGHDLKKFLETHKSNMKEKAECIFEGKKENEAHLQDVYTELFITEGDMKEVNQEREILKIDDAFHKNKQTQGKPIECNDIFTLLKVKNKKKIVLTKGVAGIGKTVSLHKFILDWAEGKANQDIHCVFLLPFRQINSIKDREFSLHEFLLRFYTELKGLEKSKLYKKRKLVFIFDGLDESQLPLEFESGIVNDVEERSSVDVLFTSLVKGTLLPSALVWVTSRPAAANQIPSQYVGLITEVRGFTDQQKEQYFRKKFTDETLADRIVKHIKTNRSLYIMCHIPVFCWITATVLQDILKDSEENISTTLTEMYIDFLLIQMNMKNQKYDKKEEREYAKNLDSNKIMILKLAKLAFEQLKKGNIVFYEEDLKECVDVIKDTEFTGMIAEIFKKEKGLHEKKVFSFVHLSVQEFLAAVHVFLCYLNKNMKELQFFFKPEEPEENITLQGLLQNAVDKAMDSERGHLDLFLRFLMGITLESSQNLLKGLITKAEDTTESIRQTTKYIKQKQDSRSISEEALVNLFYCLLELKDHSLYEEIQSYISSDAHPGRKLSSSMCTVLTYILLMSEKVLDEFNPKRFTSEQENYMRLIPAVRCCRKALFDGCGLDETCCETISSALQSSDSHLTELDLSYNHLQDSGVQLIYDGLKSSHCQLNILRLYGCKITAQSCEFFSSALQSSNSVLRELDLSNNDLKDTGVKLLSDGLKRNCKLEILRLILCNLTAQCCESLSSVLQCSNSGLKELDLSNNDLKDIGVMLLSDGLKRNCKLEILRLSGCMVTKEGCDCLSSVLSSNPSHLRELDLSYNHPGDSGKRLLSEKCKNLDKLNVDHGGESRITAGLHKYSHRLTLDLNTVNKLLRLSENNRVITDTVTDQHYPDHPDRFDGYNRQVLFRESVCGRCYWEIEWRGACVFISVSYKSIGRKGFSNECRFGYNDQSWSLFCSSSSYSFWHNYIETDLPVKPIISRTGVKGVYRVGVYVDHGAGTLSFYSVSDTMSLIHTEHTTFTQTLYPGFGVYTGSVSLC
ncbi:NACHT, LRR and PYD domains-containing protein 3-like [Garra rufa]|uniref:NACHT, LRR and PYD domains-containing protein 3-like n=1 Tax=Garra rufa TaxID=137080 RepID=UPI003CCEF492